MSERKMSILLVEDDQVDVMTVRRALQQIRVTNPLFTASDGEEALAKLRSGEIPLGSLLILLDLNMPRMSGIEMLQELRKDPELRHLPVVVLTTSDDERDKIEAYNLNVAGYILKPVTFSAFVETMATLDRYWTLVEMP